MSYITRHKPDDEVDQGTTTQAEATSIYVAGPDALPAEAEIQARTLKTAWVIEGSVISIGLLVAVMIGVQTGGILTGCAAAAPFVAAATCEFARIPLTRMAFAVRGVLFKSIAIFTLCLLSLLTAEQLLLGFEGAFTMRIESVRRAGQAAADANSRVADLEREAEDLAALRTSLEKRITGFAAEAELARSLADSDISAATAGTAAARQEILAQRDNLSRQIGDLQAQHRRADASMNALCRNTPDRCAIGALQRRQAGELAPLQQRITELDNALLGRAGTSDSERAQAIARRDTATQQVRTRKAAIEADLRTALADRSALSARLTEARQRAVATQATAQAMRQGSPMHRLAKTTLGSDDDDGAQKVLTIFATVASLTLASAGTILATLTFRSQTQNQQEIRLRGADTAGQLVVVPVPAGIEPAARKKIVDQAIATRRARSAAATFRVVPVELPQDADEGTRRKLIEAAVAAAA
jgi:hypothetical protein